MSIDFPVALRLGGLSAIVIGGGYGSGRRVRDLMDAGAKVTLIAADWPDDLPADLHLTAPGNFAWIARGYQSGDLAGVSLVVSCPADKADNAAIWQEAQLRGLFMNAIDDPTHGNFTFPAIHRQGDLSIAVSTAGKSPCLAVALRNRIAAEIGPEYGPFLELLGEIRGAVVAAVVRFADRLPIWQRLIASNALEDVRAGNIEQARARLNTTLSAALAEKDSRLNGSPTDETHQQRGAA